MLKNNLVVIYYNDSEFFPKLMFNGKELKVGDKISALNLRQMASDTLLIFESNLSSKPAAMIGYGMLYKMDAINSLSVLAVREDGVDLMSKFLEKEFKPSDTIRYRSLNFNYKTLERILGRHYD